MTYTTKQGDMWDSIAFTRMGSVYHTSDLIRANMQYHGYFSFPAGVVLELPEVEEKSPVTVPPWKR